MADTSMQKREQTTGLAERIEEGVYYTPLVDIAETNDAFIFEADMPGVKAEDMDVNFENGTLTLRGKVQSRQPDEQPYIWQDYSVGHFYRSFSIDTPVNPDAITAELKNGVLRLTVPKAEAAKTKKIQIKAQ